jgi:hypothetical protein
VWGKSAVAALCFLLSGQERDMGAASVFCRGYRPLAAFNVVDPQQLFVLTPTRAEHIISLNSKARPNTSIKWITIENSTLSPSRMEASPPRTHSTWVWSAGKLTRWSLAPPAICAAVVSSPIGREMLAVRGGSGNLHTGLSGVSA